MPILGEILYLYKSILKLSFSINYITNKVLKNDISLGRRLSGINVVYIYIMFN